MMPMTLVSWHLWVLVIGVELTVLGVVLWSKSGRQWKSIIAFLCIQTAQSLLLLGITLFIKDEDLQPALYFYAYWTGAFLTQIIEIWIIVQICTELVGLSDRVIKRIRRGVPFLAVLILVTVIALSYHSQPALYSLIVDSVTALDRSMSVSWLVTFLILSKGIDGLGVEWTSSVRGVALGLAIEVSSSMASALLADLFPKAIVLYDIRAMLYIVSLSIWGVCLARNAAHPEDALSLARLRSHLQAHLAMFRKIKGAPR